MKFNEEDEAYINSIVNYKEPSVHEKARRYEAMMAYYNEYRYIDISNSYGDEELEELIAEGRRLLDNQG